MQFASDYQEGAHPAILERLVQTNLEQTAGYGLDPHSERARELIRAACGTPSADVQFLMGGTQANAVVIDALLRPWQGVVAAESGHVSVHEAGAIEFTGHKVMTLPGRLGKITAEQVDALALDWERDENREHMVQPGMIYVSQPTEYGTLYSLAELEALAETCRAHDLLLYVDGARLAYALAAPENDVALPDLGRLCHAFYLGGTKCGALFGEAVVIPDPQLAPRFFTQVKQHGALLAKGRIAGIQFEVLFEDGLYQRIGVPAIRTSERIRAALTAAGYELYFDSPTNQTYFLVDDEQLERIGRVAAYSYGERVPDGRAAIRFATSWATRDADVDRLIKLL
ncbi:MAG: aminotransferase class I/II-fold pyridoxal phosphate-dependent enzyme [Coriobacteriia bacterium]|nr:aminotransferase class I/II-fold pyridoxal phosphate-dependent enzyme [Coriobacteriia bacterium]